MSIELTRRGFVAGMGAAVAATGVAGLNGAAARCVSVNDKIIIMCYASMTPEEARTHKPSVVFVNEDNTISRITSYEKHGRLADME